MGDSDPGTEPVEGSPIPIPAKKQARATLGELARLFLRLGLTAFGGPAAHIAMMEDEVVTRRGWLSRQRFLDLLGAANLIPGPSSSELAIYIGQSQAGWRGLLLGGGCFILPAAVLVTIIAWAYVRFGSLPAAHVAGILYGIKPVVIAIIVQALWRLARSAIKSGFLAGLAAAGVAANLAGLGPLWVILAAGAGAAFVHLSRRRPGQLAAAAIPSSLPATTGPAGLVAPAGAAVGAAGVAAISLWKLFAVFLKLGAIVFGSGYVLLAFLREDMVGRLHWLSESQLLDAVAVGQVTPGPVFTTATFIGYILAGPAGAAVATVGIFLPAFVFVSISGPLIPRLRNSPLAGRILDAINAASLAVMAVVTFQLARAAIVDWPTVALAAASGVLLLAFRLNSVWLVLLGAAAGAALSAHPF